VRFEKTTTSFLFVIWAQTENYFSVYDIAVKVTSSTAGVTVGGIVVGYGATSNRVVGCTVYDTGNTSSETASYGIYLDESGTNNVVANCFVTNVKNSTINPISKGITGAQFNTKSYYAYNNTVTNCNIGIQGATTGTFYVKNSIAQGNSTNITGTSINQTTNATSGVTFAADGYHLDSTDTGAIGDGTDLSGDGTFAFDDDIDGDTRDDWDIGADEYVTVGISVNSNFLLFFNI
jgi:hypothetical protein